MKKGRLEAKQEMRQATLPELTSNDNEIDAGIDNQDAGDNNYYIMTKEEAEALVNGDMETIERWVNNLDKNRATWLLRLLIKRRE